MFQVEDPLKRLVILKKKTWNVHIIRHQEMYRQESLVKKILEDPVYIVKDRDHPNRDDYFDLCNLPNDGSLSLLKVVVQFNNNTGEVVTAYSNKSLLTQATTGRGVIYERHSR